MICQMCGAQMKAQIVFKRNKITRYVCCCGHEESSDNKASYYAEQEKEVNQKLKLEKLVKPSIDESHKEVEELRKVYYDRLAESGNELETSTL